MLFSYKFCNDDINRQQSDKGTFPGQFDESPDTTSSFPNVIKS